MTAKLNERGNKYDGFAVHQIFVERVSESGQFRLQSQEIHEKDQLIWG